MNIGIELILNFLCQIIKKKRIDSQIFVMMIFQETQFQ